MIDWNRLPWWAPWTVPIILGLCGRLLLAPWFPV
jgi:hypothetical protein